jgi:hypothetical protein
MSEKRWRTTPFASMTKISGWAKPYQALSRGTASSISPKAPMIFDFGSDSRV